MEKITLQDCIDFHGDYCGGVVIGWIMGNFAMEKLGVKNGKIICPDCAER